MSRFDVLHNDQAPAGAAALPYPPAAIHSGRPPITTYLQDGGTLEHTQTITDHESSPTIKLYDRTREELTFEEVERIRI